MTIQEFLTQLDESPFSDATKAEARSVIGDASELTPELNAQIKEVLQKELETDFADVTLDPTEAVQIEKELTDALSAIEQEVQQDEQQVETEVQELADLSQKVDVLERLHTS